MLKAAHVKRHAMIHRRFKGGFRKTLGHMLETDAFEMFIVSMIFLDVFCVIVEILHEVNAFRHTDALKVFEDACAIVSFTILGIFAAEILLKIFCFGRVFFKSKMHVFDLIVVVLCIIVETINWCFYNVKSQSHEHHEEGCEGGGHGDGAAHGAVAGAHAAHHDGESLSSG